MQAVSTPTLDISLFGSFQLHHSIHGEIKENRRKVQALLIWLLLEDNQAHSREQLIALFWPEMNRENGLRNLRVALSRVKKHLADGEALEAKRAEVTLHQSPNHKIDIRQFEDLVHQVDHHKHDRLAGCSECLSKLRQAAKLYRGRFLDGFSLDDSEAFEEWLFVWRERYHVMGLTQLGRLAEAEFTLGRLAEAEALAQRQIKLDPLQESAHRLLMRIAAERGSRTQALRQFQICTEMLMAELGVPPDEETEQLKQQIESGDYKPRPKTTISQPKAEKSRTTAAGNLQEIITPFIGREEELTLLAERLTAREYRLISLVGPGGIGKTRLAIQAAKIAQGDFADGVFFVPLVGLSHHRDIPAAVAKATGFSLQADESDPKDQIGKILTNQEVLLVIDNLEHIIDGAGLLLDWLEAAPKLVLLITSRERINAQVEDLFRLKGLPWPADPYDPDATGYEAVRLFGDRAHRLNKAFWLNEDTLPAVVRICQQVEGMPLALELAATSIRDFDVAEIADSLTQEPELLATDLRDMPSRHRQFEAVFDYSWGLLNEKEQQTLAQLSLFAGGFTKQAAREITGASTIILTRLRYKSLIRSDGNGRFSMHELMRQMAEQKLHHSAESATQTESTHAAYFLDLVMEKAPLLVGTDAAKTATFLKSELDNIRAAWQSAIKRLDKNLVSQAVSHLIDFYSHIGFGFEAETILQQAKIKFAEAGENETGPLQMQLRILELELKGQYGRHEVFLPLFESFINDLKDWPHTKKSALYEAKAIFYSSKVLEFDVAIDVAEKALQLAYRVEDPIHLATVLCNISFFGYSTRDVQLALDRLEQAATIFQENNHIKGLSMVADQRGPAYAENGYYWLGLVYDLEALELYQQLGYEHWIPRGHQGSGLSYILLGGFEQAMWHFRQSIDKFKRMGDEQGVFASLAGMAEIEWLQGNYSHALKLYAQCISYWRLEKDFLRLCYEGIDMVRCLMMTEAYDQAHDLIDEILGHLKTFNLFDNEVGTQIVKAYLLWEMGETEAGLAHALNLYTDFDADKLVEPVKSLYELHSIFERANHPAASEVLADAHRIVSRLASEITDPEIYDSFLNNVPYCRWLRETFEYYGLPTIATPTHMSRGRSAQIG